MRVKFAEPRARMVDEQIAGRGVRDARILRALTAVPRHRFVAPSQEASAYEDRPLPIGFGQTISSPYTVARMLELLRSGKPLKRALEVGTGCGYQAAVLARLADEVYTLERIASLSTKAKRRLHELRISNVRVRLVDGHGGFPDAAPFDAIIVAAATTQVPAPLLEQLIVGGRMVLPMGIQEQKLWVIERNSQGCTQTVLEAVKFVPLRSGME